MKWAHKFPAHFFGLVKARVREKNVTSEVESCSWATRTRGNLFPVVLIFHLAIHAAVSPGFHLCLLHFLAYDVYVKFYVHPSGSYKQNCKAQLAGEGSVGGPSEERHLGIGEEKRGSHPGAQQRQKRYATMTAVDLFNHFIGGVSKFPKWRKEADAIHHLRQSKPLLIRSPGVQMNPCTGLWDHRSLASGTQLKKQRPRNPRMKRSRNWRMPRSSFQRQLRCLHFWLLMIFRLWHGLFPTAFGKIIRLIRWLYHEEIQAFPPSCQASGKVSEAEALRDSASHTFSLACHTSIFLIEQLE